MRVSFSLVQDVRPKHGHYSVQPRRRMSQVSYTELPAHSATYLDRVGEDRAELIVTRQNRPDMVVMPLAELNGIGETLHLLSTPANAKRLLDGVAQLDAGAGAEHGLIEP